MHSPGSSCRTPSEAGTGTCSSDSFALPLFFATAAVDAPEGESGFEDRDSEIGRFLVDLLAEPFHGEKVIFGGL